MYSKLRLVIFVISFSLELTYPLSDDETCHQNGQYYCKVSKECLNTDQSVSHKPEHENGDELK